MAANGGTFEVYYSRQRVTHIICSNLPNAKIKALEKERYMPSASTPNYDASQKLAFIFSRQSYL